MIDSENLRTASLYINNQLLCRGLLRDGRAIDFADPGYNEHDLADTMGRVMGVVNDLILRRDRDAEHREALSTTLRSVRADSLRQTDNLSRLHDKYTDAERKVALHEAEDAALRSQLRAAEATVQKLKDEAARARKLVAETRAACANEVRKRDRQIDGLKKAVADAGRARGERKGNSVTTIHVAGEVGADDNSRDAGASTTTTTTTTTAGEGYSLRCETNGFLAQLAKGLSEENEALLSLIRTTGDSLKEMSGWDKQDAAGSKKGDGAHAVVLVASPEDMAADMTSVLEHLRTMLTNPSFVPLEEVVVREEEIFRLRDGWGKMETRWRDAVHLIDGWRRRMAAGGHPVDMEELKMGLRLSPVRIQNLDQPGQNDPFQLSALQEEEEEEEEEQEAEEGEDQDLEEMDEDEDEGEEYDAEEEQVGFKQAESPSPDDSLHLVPAPGYEDMVPEYEESPEDDDDDSDAASSIFQDDVEDIDMDELQASEPNIEILQQSNGSTDDTNSVILPPPPKITPLEETIISGNRKPSARLTEKSKKRSSELMRETSTDSAKAPPPPPHRVKEGESPQKRLKVSADPQNDKPKSRPNSAIFTDAGSSPGSNLQAKAAPESSVSKASSKTTVKSARSDVSAKKDTPTQTSKPSTRATRAAQAQAQAQAQEKRDTPTRTVTRQKSARAIAATNASSARSAAPKQETTRARPPPAPTSSRAEMPPPPRPTKATPNNDKSLRPPPPQHDDKKPSPREKKQQQQQQQPTPSTEPSSSSSSAKRPTATAVAPESPTRSPGKSGSRLPLPRNAAPPPQQSPLTMARIAAKLAASEREADAARVRAKLRAARLGSNKGGASGNSLAPSCSAADSTSTVGSSRVASGSSADGGPRGDPTKKDRAVSGESAATGMSGSGASYSMDENGQRGGVSVLGGFGGDDASGESASSSLTAAAAAAGANNNNIGTAANDSEDDRKTVVPPPRKAAAPSSSSSPRKTGGAASPTKESSSAAAASPAKPAATRKREVRGRAAKAANRRRSTLSPWELQSLIAGEVVPSPRKGASQQEQEGGVI